MISGVQTTGLSQIFRQQTNQYSKVLEQISSGHRFNKPSEDFASFMRVNTLQSGLSELQLSNRDLVEAKENGTKAASLGDSVFEAITELRDLAKAHEKTTDTDEQAKIESDYAGRLASLTDLLKANDDGVLSASAGGLTFTGEKIDITSLAGADTDAPGMADVDGINDVLNSVAQYTAQANSFNATVDRQMTINENVMAARENTISAVRDIDDMRTIAQATELEIRRNASVSMMVQANVSQAVVARLFG